MEMMLENNSQDSASNSDLCESPGAVLGDMAQSGSAAAAGGSEHDNADGLCAEGEDGREMEVEGTDNDADDRSELKQEQGMDESSGESGQEDGTQDRDEQRTLSGGDVDSLLEQLEDEYKQINTLISQKQREWDALLKLSKMKEILILKLRRHKQVSGIVEDFESDPSMQMVMKHLSEIESEVLGNQSQSDIANSLSVDQEVSRIAKEVLGDRSVHPQFPVPSALSSQNGCETSISNTNALLATNALKNLVNRNRTLSTAPATEALLSYREKASDARSHNESNKESLEFNKRERVVYKPMVQNSSVSYTDILMKMKSMRDKDKESQANSPVAGATTTTTAKQPATLKNKSSVTSGSSAAPTAPNKAQSGTLAKLLSSTNSNSSRGMDESLPYNNKLVSNNSSSSDKSLSLANLLASAKSRDEPQQPPKKKTETPAVPVCQGCHANKAQFVCAGCANQWYCSRECQVSAWDEHSEMCSG